VFDLTARGDGHDAGRGAAARQRGEAERRGEAAGGGHGEGTNSGSRQRGTLRSRLAWWAARVRSERPMLCEGREGTAPQWERRERDGGLRCGGAPGWWILGGARTTRCGDGNPPTDSV